MSDQHTVTTTQSWGSRLGGSIKGVAIGVLLFVVAFPVLWWNEGRAVKTAKSLKEGASAVVSVSADAVDPANEGSLVHFQGRAVSDEVLADPDFPEISVNGLRLAREVEMYQWREDQRSERKTKTGGGTETVTTYTYKMDWADRVIDSSRFSQPAGHENPGSMPYESLGLTVSQANVGAFVLPSRVLESLATSETIRPQEESAAATADAPAAPAQPEATGAADPDDASIYAVAEEPAAEPATETSAADAGKPRAVAGGYYIGRDPNAPEVGDVRIRFSQAPEQDVSVIAAQQGNSVAPYQTQAGRALLMLRPGLHTADAMFEAAQQENMILTWILRVVGFVIMLVGLRMVFEPLGVLADVLPFLGKVMRMGTGLFAFLIAAGFSLITIALAWVFYRPLLGIVLLALALAPLAIAVSKAKAARKGAESA